MQLVSFEIEQTKEILNMLNIKTKSLKKEEIVLDENNRQVKCGGCNDSLTVKNVGNIAKGSKLLFCDNPICFATHLAKKNY